MRTRGVYGLIALAAVLMILGSLYLMVAKDLHWGWTIAPQVIGFIIFVGMAVEASD